MEDGTSPPQHKTIITTGTQTQVQPPELREATRRFEEHEPEAGDVRDARALRDIAAAFARVAAGERDLASAVSVARAEGHSWAAIGAMLGTSGEAARQRYGSTREG